MSYLNKKTYLFFCLIYLGFIQASYPQAASELKDVKMDYGLMLKSNPDNYYFGEIKDIAIDDERNVYVADEGTMNIKVFNKKGELIKTIGRRGRGPGEFLSMQEFYVGNGVIVVADSQNFRVSVFNLEGKLINTFNFKQNGDIVYFNELIKLPNGPYLVLYKILNEELEGSDYLFHVWNEEFSEILYEFGSLKKLTYKNDYGKKWASYYLGSFEIDANGDILLSPNVPTGKIYKYVKRGGRYQLGKTIESSGKFFPATESYPNEPANKPAGVIHSDGKTLYGLINTLNEGIFLTDKNYVVNFQIDRIPNEPDEELNMTTWELGVKVHSPSLKFVDYFPLDTLARTHKTLKADIKKSDSGDFYMITHKNDFPVVREFSLNFIYEE